MVLNKKDETMTRLNARSWCGFAGGVLAAVAVMAAMGAGTTATDSTPRYATQTLMLPGGMWLLTVADNQTNKLYMYRPDTGAKDPAFKLDFAIDLSQTGKTVLKGEMAEKPAESPSNPQ